MFEIPAFHIIGMDDDINRHIYLYVYPQKGRGLLLGVVAAAEKFHFIPHLSVLHPSFFLLLAETTKPAV